MGTDGQEHLLPPEKRPRIPKNCGIHQPEGEGCIHQISVLRDLPLMLSLRILLCKHQLRISGCRNQSAFGKKTCLLCDCWNVVNVFRTVGTDIDFWSMSSRLQMDIENPSIGVSKFRGNRFRRMWVWNLFFGFGRN